LTPKSAEFVSVLKYINDASSGENLLNSFQDIITPPGAEAQQKHICNETTQNLKIVLATRHYHPVHTALNCK